jgi:hypothetical protein
VRQLAPPREPREARSSKCDVAIRADSVEVARVGVRCRPESMTAHAIGGMSAHRFEDADGESPCL